MSRSIEIKQNRLKIAKFSIYQKDMVESGLIFITVVDGCFLRISRDILIM